MILAHIYSAGFIFVIVCACLNALVVYTFAKLNTTLQFKDLFMVSMGIGDLLQTMIGYTMEICSMILRQNQKTLSVGLGLCKASGFIVTFLALSSTTHLAVLAFDRYISVCKPFLASRLHEAPSMTYLVLFLSWLYALLWSIFPLCSWSGYELEKDNMRCSIHWSSKLLKDQMYIIFLFVFCFFVPVAIMIYSFVSVKKEIRQMQFRAANLFGKESAAVKDTIKAEKRHTRLALFMCTIFIVTWSPYSFLSFWAAFFEHVAVVPSALGTTAAIIAKSSTIINPIIYSFLHKRFRQCLRESAIGKYICCHTAVGPSEGSTNTRLS